VPDGVGCAFGPYQVHFASRRLMRGTEGVALGSRHFDVLATLVSQAGRVIPKQALLDAGWQDVAVTDNSVERVISELRVLLGPSAPGESYIRTIPRHGYMFVGAVEPLRATDAGLDEALEPHRAWMEGRAALERLGRDEAGVALRAFERAIEAAPHDAALHVGLANACAWQFEATRADDTPAVDLLARAVAHAREACRLDLQYGEAWATLGFVLNRAGDVGEGLAAARRAVSLEPASWRHHLRLAFVSWGDERLRAADRARQILPGLALAHWLIATVHVARQALDAAWTETERGSAAQDAQDAAAPFGAVGLHWLRGLLLYQRGELAGAIDAFERELTFEASGHMYARECCANAWYAIAVTRTRSGQPADAVHAFDEALARLPLHVQTLAMLSTSDPAMRDRFEAAVGRLEQRGVPADAAVARATALAQRGAHEAAAAVVRQMLTAAPPGAAAWIVPIEPALQVTAHPAAWAGALARLRTRAG
jgi:DNA-binding winged helix-turn-helix (wHTH) protein/tetratricopeptide (TPR) repeat protein